MKLRYTSGKLLTRCTTTAQSFYFCVSGEKSEATRRTQMSLPFNRTLGRCYCFIQIALIVTVLLCPDLFNFPLCTIVLGLFLLIFFFFFSIFTLLLHIVI